MPKLLCFVLWIFGIWNLANEIATPRQVGARNDNGGRAQNDAPFLSLRGARFLAYARNRLRNLVVGLELAGGFILGAEASSANVDFSFPSFYHNRSSVNIR